MNYLLDTHAFIWFVEGDPQLSSRAKLLITNGQSEKYISIVSFFEIAVKIKIGKLSAFENINKCFTDAQNQGFRILQISEQHLTAYNQVPLFPDHRDPFDRMIIATAMAESFTIITTDDKFALYKDMVDLAW